MASFVHPLLLKEVSGAVLLGVAASAALVVTKVSSLRRRQRNPAELGASERSFSESLATAGYSRDVAATVHRYLQQVQSARFPVLPGDTLDWDLGLDPDMIGRSLSELAGRLHRLSVRGPLPVTVEDMVRMLERAPRQSQIAAA